MLILFLHNQIISFLNNEGTGQTFQRSRFISHLGFDETQLVWLELV